MTLEALHFTDTQPNQEMGLEERLIERRQKAQLRLAQASFKINVANQEYHDSIVELMQSNAAFAAAGIDPTSYVPHFQNPHTVSETLFGSMNDDTFDTDGALQELPA